MSAEAGVLGLYWSRVTWLVLWLGAAFFTALPQPGEGGVVFMLFVNQHEAPGPLRSMDSSELGWLTVGHTTIVGIAVAVACLAAGFAVFLGVLPRLFLSLSVVVAAAGWVAVQNLGGILTGSTTDVGSGPLLVLLTLAFWPMGSTRRWLAKEQPAAAAPPLPAPERESQQAPAA